MHSLHTALRPDIYAPHSPAISSDEFYQACEDNALCVAEENNSVVGLVWFQFRSVSGEGRVSRRVLFIDVLAVDKEHRGKGLGRMLLDFARARAQEEKCDGVELQVNARNAAARAFYAQCGFAEKSINLELL